MRVNRIGCLLLVISLLIPFTVSALHAESAPQFNTIVIANSPTADERDPAAAYNPTENQWHVVYETEKTAYYRLISADGQSAQNAVVFDAEGGVSEPLVAVAATGLALYPFFDVRFDPPPPGLNTPGHYKDCDCGDCSTGRTLPYEPPFDVQYPLASGPGEQYPAAIFPEEIILRANGPLGGPPVFHFVYAESRGGSPHRLYDAILPNGFPGPPPIPLSDGTKRATTARGVPLPGGSGGGLFLWLEEGTIHAANVLTSTVNTHTTYASTVTGANDLGLAIGPQGATIIYRTGNESDSMLSYFQINPLTLERTSDPAVLQSENRPDDPTVACLGNGRCLAVWEQEGNQKDIWGAFFQNGVPEVKFPISEGTATERDPAVAANPEDNTFLVLWVTGAGGSRDVMGTIVEAAPPPTSTPTSTPTTVAVTGTPTTTPTPTAGLRFYLPLILD